MDHLEHKTLADNEDLQERLLGVVVQRYQYHDDEGDRRLARLYLERANELAAKYGLQQFLRNLLNV